MTDENKIIEQCKNIIEQLNILSDEIFDELFDDEKQNSGYLLWLKRCAIENMESIIFFIEKEKDAENDG